MLRFDYMSQYYSDSIFWIEVEKIKPNPYQPQLRSACITLVSSLISIPNKFQGSSKSEKNLIYSDVHFTFNSS